jgi:hypothetical protein
LRFYAEAFYYFAWRFTRIARRVEIQHEGQTLTLFKGFECRGINTARNRLIEHSDRRDGQIASNFISDCPSGFIIHALGRAAGGPIDPGLYPNAQELLHGSNERLSRVRPMSLLEANGPD